jgi:hypothetical protein
MDMASMQISASGTPGEFRAEKPKTTQAATFYDGPQGNVAFNVGIIG